jgi:hypothetical protein
MAPHLSAFASLPAESYRPGPTCGQFIKAANGIGVPFLDRQPIQGISGLCQISDSHFWALADNGFGSRANSADFVLCIYRIEVDFKTRDGGSGSIRVLETIPLSDPNHLFPSQIVAEMLSYPTTLAVEIPVHPTIRESRLLTGADLDPESFVVLPDGNFLIGDEFGPALLVFSRDGSLLEGPFLARISAVDGSPSQLLIASPDNHWIAAQESTIPASGGFEALALTPDKQTALALLERPLMSEADPLCLRLLSFDLAQRAFSPNSRRYRRDGIDSSIGDMTFLDEQTLLVIERDYNEGPAAASKRLYRVNLSQEGEDGFLAKTLLLDLLSIPDPWHLASSTHDEYTMPFVSIEGLCLKSPGALGLITDNNFPFGAGRASGRPDNTEFVVIQLDPESASR